MQSPAVSEWDNDYARVARVASQLRTQGLSSSFVTQQELEQHVARLDAALTTLPLTNAEIQRRRRLIQHLKTTSHNNRNYNDLMSNSNSSYTSPPDSTGSSGVGQQKQQQQSHMSTAMRQQDDMIDELAVGVSRLRDQTQVIHDEARMHVNLLGEMETNLEAAHQGLDEETKRAAKLKEDQSVW
eukprot:CAMPEP_0178734238 /NCGR_PEP_ID=MMETSP0744-20121128/1238_1 /TAXON_ID=913974 /ORGANISM="Nitzschia punctata, Strain CCMP561" /LENGTH=183 /DNA_ID=CAMNT_0020386507 /DNA_START=17 /DNA_END=565 /DNA_ORIENTATION=-